MSDRALEIRIGDVRYDRTERRFIVMGFTHSRVDIRHEGKTAIVSAAAEWVANCHLVTQGTGQSYREFVDESFNARLVRGASKAYQSYYGVGPSTWDWFHLDGVRWPPDPGVDIIRGMIENWLKDHQPQVMALGKALEVIGSESMGVACRRTDERRRVDKMASWPNVKHGGAVRLGMMAYLELASFGEGLVFDVDVMDVLERYGCYRDRGWTHRRATEDAMPKVPTCKCFNPKGIAAAIDTYCRARGLQR